MLDTCTAVAPAMAPGPDGRLLRCHNPVRRSEEVPA
jgi:hypothetical protein